MRSEIWALDERPRTIGRTRNEPIQLTSGPIAWGQPVPSKDGVKIFAAGKTYQGELLRFDAKRKQFEPFLRGISAQGVAFSRDGKYVVYIAFPEGTLWKANRDGSHPVQLTDKQQIEAFEPRWSPDGSQIIFSSFTSVPYQFAPAPCQTYIVSAEGGAPQRLLPDEKEPVADPNWSADGRRILFSTWQQHETKGDLRILDLMSHQITTLPGSAGVHSPRWSLDGRFIAALSSDSLRLKVFDTATQRWLVMPQVSPKDSIGRPEWSKDSQSIYFLDQNTVGGTGVYRVRVMGGAPALVAGIKDFNISGWWDSWMGLDDADAPLVLKDVGTDDVYALTMQEK